MAVIMNVSPERLEELKAGKNDKSEEVISYFLEDKCCSSGMKDKDYQELVSEFANSVTPQNRVCSNRPRGRPELEPVRLMVQVLWGLVPRPIVYLPGPTAANLSPLYTKSPICYSVMINFIFTREDAHSTTTRRSLS